MEFRRALNPHVNYDADGDLHIDGVKASSIIAEHATPTYVYSISRIRERYNTILNAYKKVIPSVSIHYSMKANANMKVLKTLIEMGSGIDCVSGGEVFKALKAGCSPEKIVFAGVGKTKDEIDYAVEQGVIWFDVENEHEVDHIAASATKHDKEGKVNIAYRVNPDVQADTHPSIATGHGGAKFGLPITVVNRLLDEAPKKFPHVNFKGLHLHIGSQLGSVEPTVRAISQTLKGLEGHLTNITHLNIGGGLPANYGHDTSLPTEDDFASAVASQLQGYHVMLEPGRSITGEAGTLLSTVLYRKDQNGQKMIIVDASMTDLMRPALYQAEHPIGPITLGARAKSPPEERSVENAYDIVGPVCESTDVLAKGVVLPADAAQPDAQLAILTSGAYGASMASNYNARGFVAEVVVENGKAELSRRRQKWDDLIRDELH